MPGRPWTQVRRVEQLESKAASLAQEVYQAAPAMYVNDPGSVCKVPNVLAWEGYDKHVDGAQIVYRPARTDRKQVDPVARAWQACLTLSAALSIEVEQLGNLLRRRVRIQGQGKAEEGEE